MMYTYKHETVTWIDIESPTREEILALIEQYDIDALTAEELLNPTQRSRVDLHKDYIYLILHFPTQLNPKHAGIKHKIDEIDFIIGKNFIITTHYSSINTLLEFSKIFETDSLLTKQHLNRHAGYVFYHMIRNIYRSLNIKIEDLKATLSSFEDEIFEGKEREMVFELSKMSRVILHFKESLNLHSDILSSFEEAGKKIFEPEFAYYLRAVAGEYSKVEKALESAEEYLDELRKTNDSLLSTKQNEIMKTLTVVNFIILPLTLVTGVFGMNTMKTPIVERVDGFWIICAILILLAVLAALFFKRKRWL